MSKKDGKASGKVPDEPENHSVYDFLYCDTRRIGSFLSQFDDSGHLQQVIQREDAKTVLKRGAEISIGGGGSLMGTGGSANLGFKRGPGNEASEGSERIYDPLWTNARTFLDYLAEADLLKMEMEKARIGEFVLVKGKLSIIDLSLLASLWSKQSIVNLISSGANQQQATPTLTRQQRRALARTDKVQSTSADETRLMLDIIESLPHTAQAYIQSPEIGVVWCTLNADSLVVNSGDLLLKHGITIDGEWAVVGILDGRPSDGSETSPDDTMRALGIDPELGVGIGAGVLMSLAPVAQSLLGRQPTAFGITPLLIFREVAG